VLRSMLYEQLNDPDSKTELTTYMFNSLQQYYLQELFDLKREYLRLWDQENGDYERYIVLNRYDDLAREVLELDRHVFMSVAYDATVSHPTVTLRTLFDDRPIYYTLDGSDPTASSTKYEGPFPLEHSATIRAITYNEYGEGVISEQYLLSHLAMGAKITLNTPYSTYKAIYSGGGNNALIDGQLGSNSTYADGHWQGYWGDSIDAVIDFGKPTAIHEVTMRFMQNTFDWILAPWDIVLMVSDDGEHWTIQVNWPGFNFSPRETGMRLRTCTVPIYKGVTTRYLRVIVPPAGPLPSWHPAPGQPSYLFTDEIIVK
ncbi:MAG: chitobiase/beta-hexosaminidase C-terminal domain-containing protein, partial [Bacteroidales bacterium]|nr:chitobiase/beta-hexosaminidase C-terminal domain-containing protein [Bacteroidales bacterium]